MFKKKKGAKATSKSKSKKPNPFAGKAKTPPTMPGEMSSVMPKQMPGAGGMPFGR